MKMFRTNNAKKWNKFKQIFIFLLNINKHNNDFFNFLRILLHSYRSNANQFVNKTILDYIIMTKGNKINNHSKHQILSNDKYVLN